MGRPSHFVLAAVVCLVSMSGAASMAATAPKDASRHEIELFRAALLGQRVRLHGEATEERIISQSTSSDGADVNRSTLSIVVDLEREVQEVDARGGICKAAFAVTECLMTRAGRTTEIAAPGSVIVATYERVIPVFTIGGEPVTGDAARALALIAAVNVDDASGDGAFGSSGPRAVGERWDINVDRVASDLRRRSGQPVLKHDVTGEVSLVGLQEHEGKPCIVVNTHVAVRNVLPELDEFSMDLQLQDATLTSMFQGIYPTDTTLPASGEAVSMSINAVLIGPVGHEGALTQVRVSTKRTVRRELQLISGAGVLTMVED